MITDKNRRTYLERGAVMVQPDVDMSDASLMELVSDVTSPNPLYRQDAEATLTSIKATKQMSDDDDEDDEEVEVEVEVEVETEDDDDDDDNDDDDDDNDDDDDDNDDDDDDNDEDEDDNKSKKNKSTKSAPTRPVLLSESELFQKFGKI